MRRFCVIALAVAGLTFLGSVAVPAHCGKCEADHKHKHEHPPVLKTYKKGETKCCSADHFAGEQKKAIAAEAKKAYKKGETKCCSADHFSSKQVKAAEMATFKAAYKKGETKCCSADHFAKKKMKAVKKAK